jgi:hypothetical protein
MGSMGNLLVKSEATPSADRLTRISRQIGENTQILTEGLHARGLSAPSYEAEGPPDFPLTGSDAKTLKARQQVLSLTKELRDLVLGPREALKLMALDVSCAPLKHIYIHACIYTCIVVDTWASSDLDRL